MLLTASPDAPPHAAIGAPPSRNSTLPVGLPKPETVGATFAVKVTCSPVTAGLAEGDKEVVVGSWLLKSAPSLFETETLPAASTASTMYWALPLDVTVPVPLQFRPSVEVRLTDVHDP